VKSLRIGSRGSALALWQANHIRERLFELHGVQAEIIRIQTSGDRMQNAPVAQIAAAINPAAGSPNGTKGIFIKELEEALLEGTVDLAVHSMKDVPTETPGGLAFPAIPVREDPRDCLISASGKLLKDLPAGARIGTSSLRRQAQLLHYRPDLLLADLRGNVDTRLRKVAAGEFDAIVLATAGVKRLGAAGRITEILRPEIMLPAVAQGALGIETRADDSETIDLILPLDDLKTHTCVTAERALLRELEGGCQVPVGASAWLDKGKLWLDACVFSPDGKEFVRQQTHGAANEPEATGKRLGKILIEAGADRILRLATRTTG
jgi:hydroxymethylbilane synthase